MSYQERLKNLRIDSLELRRLRNDLVYTYKILFGLVDVKCDEFFTLCSNEYNTRGHAYKLAGHHSRLDIRKYWFCERVVKPWNSLSAQPEDFSNLKCFKRFLINTDLTNYVTVC